MREEFKQSAGDTVTIQMNPINFVEFIKACGKYELYESLDLYGNFIKEDYEEIHKYFNLDSIQGMLVDYNSLEGCIYGITRLLLKETNCNLAMAWIDRAGLINDCCKVIDFKFDEKTFNQRFYFNDVGLSNYLFDIYNENKNNNSEINGLINETFIFNELRKISKPNFGMYNKGELDFVYFDKETSLLYGIEVKAGKNAGGTITTALQDGKIDRALYCKGNTYGGIDGKKITIPIYLFSKFDFNAVNN